MPDPTRELAYASVRLFNVGHGDPIVIDPGLVWYDPQSQNEKAGTSSYNALGRPLTEWIDGVGRCTRMFMVQQNTQTSHGISSGGTWENRVTGTGRAITRLSQSDSANTVTAWAFTFTGQPAPKDPEFAFSISLPDTPADWDFATYEPFVRLEVGGTYAVVFTKDGTFLARNAGAGLWPVVQDLPNPPRSAGWGDAEEVFVWFRALRGKVCISVDQGRSYAPYTPEDGPASIPQGNLVLRGRGGAILFGLHQLKAFTGTWDAPIRYLERPRISPGATFANSRYAAPAGNSSDASVAFSDQGNGLARQAGYRVTLTPAVTSGSLWNWYRSAVLYATEYRIPRVVQNLGNDYTTPWDADLMSIQISKPVDLAGSTANFTVALDAADENDLEGFRWRKVEIETGYHLSDGSDEVYTSFVGYIAGFAVAKGATEEFSKVMVTFQVANATMRLRRDPWGFWRQIPLGGRTPNDAADEILYWHGLGASYRTWHSAGDFGLIPTGSPEEPCELCNPNELPWETLVRIFAERGLEVGVDDVGVLYTLPKSYVSGSVDHELRSTPELADDERNTPSQVEYRTDYRESCTAALAYGKDENGRFVFASAYDSDAETNVASPRFTPWRETALREIPGTVTSGYLVGHAQALAGEKFPVDRQVDFTIPIDPRHSRREQWALFGFAAEGLPDDTRCVLLTMDHTWEAGKGLTALSTRGGLKRLDT